MILGYLGNERYIPNLKEGVWRGIIVIWTSVMIDNYLPMSACFFEFSSS
jgi:hypothetical protein